MSCYSVGRNAMKRDRLAIRRRWALAAACLAAVSAAPLAAAAPEALNGGFDNGCLGGWTVYNQAGGSGNWFAYNGTISPLSGHLIAPPPEGSFAATTDQTGPGTHILYQDFALEAGSHHSLSFVVYYANFASFGF